MQELDNQISWTDFYREHVGKISPCGNNKMNALCPFHKERHPSFWFNTKNGCFKCEGCGASGNATVFLSMIKGIDQKEAYKELCARVSGTDAPPAAPPPYTVAQYAEEKCLMVSWLHEECGITDGKDYAGTCIRIPYKDASGEVQAVRKRYHKDNPKGKFKWQKGAKLCLYGLWRKPSEDYVILCEGESDAQSLWALGFSAFGVPGASNFQAAWVTELKKYKKLYLHIEPDRGGETFRRKCMEKLLEGGYDGEVYLFSLTVYNVKDPSELYIQKGMEAESCVQAAMAAATCAPLNQEEELPELIEGMPTRLKEPDGWRMAEDGIFRYDAKTEQFRRICSTPIMISKRLRGVDTGEERVQIAFKRHGRWTKETMTASTLYQARGVVQLADYGAMITSENARGVVSFLEALESENISRIPEAKSVSQLGWASDTQFLPGLEGDIELTVDRSLWGRVNAYEKSGSLSEWLKEMARHRSFYIFRFILAASFAPPLLKLLRQRIFFVYNWGGSEGGKSAALYAALSAWGDPERLKVSFNATNVGLETIAAFYKDLPLGLNERQLAGGRQEALDRIVYTMAEGSGRTRGTKNNGLQATKQWRTVVIANGEEPLTDSSSQTGVSTRIIEIYGAPFPNPEDASSMYGFTAQHHGHAGIAFVSRLLTLKKSGTNQTPADAVRDIREKIKERLSAVTEKKSRSHIDGVATIATADALVSLLLYGEKTAEAIDKAVVMGVEILKSQQTNESRDVNMHALQFIVDWLQSNAQQFKANCYGQSFGFIDGERWYIYPSVLDEALKKNEYSPRKTRRFLADKNVIESLGSHYSIMKRVANTGLNRRMISLSLPTAMAVLEGEPDDGYPF